MVGNRRTTVGLALAAMPEAGHFSPPFEALGVGVAGSAALAAMPVECSRRR